MAALKGQRVDYPFEVVVVDDGSDPPVEIGDLAGVSEAKLVRGRGAGPGDARNLGLNQARGGVILFTDDDTVADSHWLHAALEFLDSHPEAVGVEGPIVSLPYDPLYEISLESTRPGAYYTANVAYRHAALERLGGFRPELFPLACEDVDLGLRAAQLGTIGYSERMLVRHVPRRISILGRVRRGRLAAAEVALKREHPSHFGRAAGLPGPIWAVLNGFVYYAGLARAERARLARRPWLIGRLILMACGHAALALPATLLPTRPRSSSP